MKNEFNLLLTTKKYHLIKSKKTKDIYIDEQARCFLFESDVDAELFCKEVPDTFFEEEEQFVVRPFMSRCRSAGIKVCRVREGGKDKYADIPVDNNETQRQFYNGDTMRTLLLLRETGKKEYLNTLRDCPFIAALTIEDRKEGEPASLKYGYASFTANKGERFYLLFSSFREFENWKTRRKTDAEPYLITISKFMTLISPDGFFINPESTRIRVTCAQIKAAKN